MIELKEKAGIYAEESVINVLKEAFAKVYADGYRDGYGDCQAEKPVNLCDGNTEYVDLGLPSGTLWSSDYERIDDRVLYQTYGDAVQMNLPTKEQCEELLRFCKFNTSYGPVFECVGPNGKFVRFRSTGYIRTEKVIVNKNNAYLWHVDDEDLYDNKNAVRIMKGDSSIQVKQASCFVGYKLPIRLVKNNQK